MRRSASHTSSSHCWNACCPAAVSPFAPPEAPIEAPTDRVLAEVNLPAGHERPTRWQDSSTASTPKL